MEYWHPYLMLVEPKETTHTGEIITEKTVTKLDWISATHKRKSLLDFSRLFFLSSSVF